jgi:hypothetical protein
MPKHHNKGVLPELLIGARVSGVAPAGGVREERRKQSKGKRISRAVTGKQLKGIHTRFYGWHMEKKLWSLQRSNSGLP